VRSSGRGRSDADALETLERGRAPAALGPAHLSAPRGACEICSAPAPARPRAMPAIRNPANGASGTVGAPDGRVRRAGWHHPPRDDS